MLLLISLAFFYFRNAEAACVAMEEQENVPTAPSLTINTLEFPDDHVLPVGYNVTIVCTSNASKVNYGNPSAGQPYWIHFYFNDNSSKIEQCGGRRNDVEERKVCTHVIQNASRSDSGTYTCWANNLWSCTFGSIELVFKESSTPIFTVNPPAKKFISRGGKANLTCKVAGIPNPVITWYKDGIAMPDPNITEARGLSTLTLELVTAVYQGEYWCEARNSQGWSKSSSTILSMKQRPTISLHPQNVAVSLKQNITMVSFACKAAGSPPPVVTWLKNNSTQPNGTVLEIDGISWLILVLVEKQHNEDRYICVARNSEGEAYSTEAMVIITVPGDTSASTKDDQSPLLWILVAVAGGLLFVMVLLILRIYKKNRNAAFRVEKEIMKEQRYSNLYIN